MEFISAEEFLKQPKEVQEIFLEWWKCEEGDLYLDKKEYETDARFIDVLCCNMTLEGDIEGDWQYLKSISIPLLTECQLRRFIEEKTNGIVKLIQWHPSIDNEKHGYEIHILAKDKYKVLCTFNYKLLGIDLLQAYWKVAVQIAEQEGK